MKKTLILSILALTASLAHAGSCGGDYDTDKKGDKSGVVEPTMTIACGKSNDGDKKTDPKKTGFTIYVTELACDTSGDGKGKSDKLFDSTVIGAIA